MFLCNNNLLIAQESVQVEEAIDSLCAKCDSVERINFYYYSWAYNAISYKEEDIRNNIEGQTKTYVVKNNDTINYILSHYYNSTNRNYGDAIERKKASTMVIDIHRIDGTVQTILVSPYFSLSDNYFKGYWNMEFILHMLTIVPRTDTTIEKNFKN